MTVNELKEEFLVLKNKESWLIHSKEEGTGRMVYKYLCQATKKGNTFVVDGFKPAKTIGEFRANVEKYVNQLPYDSEYDSPLWIKGLREELMVRDYLKSIGFEKKQRIEYSTSTKSIYGGETNKVSLWFKGLDPHETEELPNDISIFISTQQYASTELQVSRNFESIKDGIKTLLRQYYNDIILEITTKLEQL